MKIECIKTGITAGVQEYCVRFKGENTISITLTERDLLNFLDEAQKQLSKDDGVINLLQMNRSIQDLTEVVERLANEILELKTLVPACPQQHPWNNPTIYRTDPIPLGPITCSETEETRTNS